MSNACNSEVKRTTDAHVSEDQKTEVPTDPVHRQDLCCSMLRGQVRVIQLGKKTVEFQMVQHIGHIVSVAVAMRDCSHRFSKLKDHRHHNCDARLRIRIHSLEDDGEFEEGSSF